MKYEGRSINKLQNGAVSLMLKLSKIRNIRYILQITKIHQFVTYLSNDPRILITDKKVLKTYAWDEYLRRVNHFSTDKRRRNEVRS